MKVFYTYVHFRESDNRAFYVGKGSGKRAWVTRRPAHWRRVASKHGVRVEVAARWSSEEEAFSHERLLIACFRDMGHPLCNCTDGGDGVVGYRFTDAAKEKMSTSRTGAKASVETRAKMSASGKVKSAETLRKISPLGRVCSDATRAKISAAQKGAPKSEAYKANMSKVMTGKTLPESVREKITASAQSPESRARQSAAMAGKPWSEARRAAQPLKGNL